LIRDKFRQLLVEISEKGEATDEDTEEVRRWVDLYACKEWKKSFMGNLNLDTFAMNEAFPLARVVHNLLSPINKYLEEEDEEQKDNDLVITVVAHGSINTSLQMPSRFYYMTPSLLSITLYSPWGCAVDASVVHGICTNTINIQNVKYNGDVKPEIPAEFNKLPREMDMIPTLKFSPVRVGEDAHVALARLFQIFNENNLNGILIKYFTGKGENLLPYPEVPLWLFAAAASVCSVFVSRHIRIQVASCLSVDATEQENGMVDCQQYYVVDGTKTPPVTMVNEGSIPEDIAHELASLNEIL